MTDTRRGRVLGTLVIIIVWVVAGGAALAVGTILFLHIEGRYLITEEHEEDVSIVKLQGTATELMSNHPISVSYLLRMADGDVRVVDFLPGASLAPGDRIRMRYVRTWILGGIILRDFEKIESASTGASQAGPHEARPLETKCSAIGIGSTEEEVVALMGTQYTKIDLTGTNEGKHVLLFQKQREGDDQPHVVINDETSRVEKVFCGD